MMVITALVATSLDGLISHDANSRLMMSSEEDLDASDELRSKADAILVGAATIRKDNSSLLIKKPELVQRRLVNNQSANPIKVTLTRSGLIPLDSKFVNDGQDKKLIFVSSDSGLVMDEDFCRTKNLEIIPLKKDENPARSVVEDLANRGCKNIIIEGGTDVLTMFFKAGLIDKLRLSICPFLIGQDAAPRLIKNIGFDHHSIDRFKVLSVQTLGDTVVIDYLVKKP